MHDHSFEFNGTDMFTAYGFRIRKKHSVLKPALRERKVVIPSRSGAYDFGANTYDELSLLVECDTIRQLSKSDLRELSLLMSQKGKIVFWDEPDKYYFGRIYDAAEIERVGGIGTYIPFTFICDPFAYSCDESTELFFALNTTSVEQTVDYKGTVEAPTKISIQNVGAAQIVAVTIAIKRRV